MAHVICLFYFYYTFPTTTEEFLIKTLKLLNFCALVCCKIPMIDFLLRQFFMHSNFISLHLCRIECKGISGFIAESCMLYMLVSWFRCIFRIAWTVNRFTGAFGWSFIVSLCRFYWQNLFAVKFPEWLNWFEFYSVSFTRAKFCVHEVLHEKVAKSFEISSSKLQ